MSENSYGNHKRLEYIKSVMLQYHPVSVLDIGCGSGKNLTEPLASIFPNIRFVAIDNDRKTIQYAKRENKYANVSYFLASDLKEFDTFNMVISSEVLEHVESPVKHLNKIQGHLSKDGVVVLTLPNGYGPYEWASLIESLFYFFGGYKFVRIFKRNFYKNIVKKDDLDTLAISPHINFFSYRNIKLLIKSSGFKVIRYQPRSFLCGFGFDHVIRANKIIQWNCELANRLPPQLVSAWMFVLVQIEAGEPEVFQRNMYARIKRHINEQRWTR